jgi:hypothetical protein
MDFPTLQANEIKIICSQMSIQFPWKVFNCSSQEYFARFGKVECISNLKFESKNLFSCEILFADYYQGLKAILETDGQTIAVRKSLFCRDIGLLARFKTTEASFSLLFLFLLILCIANSTARIHSWKMPPNSKETRI